MERDQLQGSECHGGSLEDVGLTKETVSSLISLSSIFLSLLFLPPLLCIVEPVNSGHVEGRALVLCRSSYLATPLNYGAAKPH